MDRIQLLRDTQNGVISGKIKICPTLPRFGFRNFETLHDVDLFEEIKGYPCIAYNDMEDAVKFGIKVNPLEKEYPEEQHPARMEAKLLKEFTRCVIDGMTPHITFYFCDMDITNSKSAITKFPLKSVSGDIYKTSSVLVSEYVNGGSIDDWVNALEDIGKKPSLEQWRYIVFSMVWTLVVLQDRYQFVHRDFHVGNILIDNTLPKGDKSVYGYTLEMGSRGEKVTFNVRSCGIVPKIWDLEFSNCFRRIKMPTSPLGCHNDSRPNEFDPYYDLHFFFMTLLEVCDLPEIEKLVTSLYPPELVPEGLIEDDHGSNCSTCSSYSSSSEFSQSFDSTVIMNNRSMVTHGGGSRSGSTSSSSGSSNGEEYEIFYPHFEDLYYYTDEDISDDEGSMDMDDDDESSSSFDSSSCSSDVTPYLYKNRMRNGVHLKFKNLPTPMSMLSHPFFNCYRKPVKEEKAVVFSYKITGNVK